MSHLKRQPIGCTLALMSRTVTLNHIITIIDNGREKALNKS
uniref:Uncharacterized protein n=1 Tax=Amphimedon queenslandica TaxID=400682 RepID=A0A1X7SZI9_AMPQE